MLEVCRRISAAISPLTSSRQVTAIAFVITILVAIGSLTWPMGEDHAYFFWVANVIPDGGIPYRDAWEQKGPLTYYIYAFAAMLFGSTDIAPRVLDLFAIVAGGLLLRKLVLRLNGNDVLGANTASIVFLLAYYQWGFWNTALPDEWGGILLLLVILVLVDPPWSIRWTLAAAAGLVALATLLKPTFLVFLLLPMAKALEPSIRRDNGAVPLFLCVLTFISATLLSLLVLLHGDLKDYWSVFRFQSSGYAPPRNVFHEITGLLPALYSVGLLVPFLLAPFGLWHIHRGSLRREALLVGIWFALAVFVVALQGRYVWPGHWGPAAFVICALFGVALSFLAIHLPDKHAEHWKACAVALLTGLYIVAPWEHHDLLYNFRWPAYLLGFQQNESYRAYITSGEYYSTLRAVSAYIEGHSTTADKVLVWGNELSINVFSHRKSPTRFGYSLPLVLKGSVQEQFQKTFMKEVTADPPKYLVIDTGTPWFLTDRSGLQLLEEFGPFFAFVHNRYRQVDTVGDFQILLVVGNSG